MDDRCGVIKRSLTAAFPRADFLFRGKDGGHKNDVLLREWGQGWGQRLTSRLISCLIARIMAVWWTERWRDDNQNREGKQTSVSVSTPQGNIRCLQTERVYVHLCGIKKEIQLLIYIISLVRLKIRHCLTLLNHWSCHGNRFTCNHIYLIKVRLTVHAPQPYRSEFSFNSSLMKNMIGLIPFMMCDVCAATSLWPCVWPLSGCLNCQAQLTWALTCLSWGGGLCFVIRELKHALYSKHKELRLL